MNKIKEFAEETTIKSNSIYIFSKKKAVIFLCVGMICCFGVPCKTFAIEQTIKFINKDNSGAKIRKRDIARRFFNSSRTFISNTLTNGFSKKMVLNASTNAIFLVSGYSLGLLVGNLSCIRNMFAMEDEFSIFQRITGHAIYRCNDELNMCYKILENVIENNIIKN